jgi:hypothetical protein
MATNILLFRKTNTIVNSGNSLLLLGEFANFLQVEIDISFWFLRWTLLTALVGRSQFDVRNE